MPNHVTNILTVLGSYSELAQFAAVPPQGDVPDVVQDHVPMPDDIRNTTSPVQIVADVEEAKRREKQRWLDNERERYGEQSPEVLAKKWNEWTAMLPQHFNTAAEVGALISKYGVSNWYDWARKYWGTKWGAYDQTTLYQDSNMIVYKFDTAWSPPLAALETMSKRYPNLRFCIVSHDEGWIYESNVMYCDGEAVVEVDWKPDSADPDDDTGTTTD
jgi:hypothetical protein